MDDIKLSLNELLKGKAKINDKKAQDISNSLFAVCIRERDISQLADFLLRFDPLVSCVFFQKYSGEMSQNDLSELIDSLLSRQSALKIKADNFWIRVCSILSVYAAKLEVPAAVCSLFKKGLQYIDTSEGFSKRNMLVFNTKVLPFFNKDAAICGLNDWNDFDCSRLVRFVRTLTDEGFIPQETFSEWVETNKLRKYLPESSTGTETLARVINHPKEPEDTGTKNPPEPEKQPCEDLEVILTEALHRANSLIKENKKDKAEIESLGLAVTGKDTEILRLNETIIKNKEALDLARAELSGLYTQLSDARSKIEKLTKEMQGFAKMHEDTLGDKIITLKNDISSAIKNEYSVYVSNLSQPCNEDILNIYKSCLSNLFKKLKRFNISADTEGNL
jgi:hypothetical protein